MNYGGVFPSLGGMKARVVVAGVAVRCKSLISFPCLFRIRRERNQNEPESGHSHWNPLLENPNGYSDWKG